ncbi:MAG: TetR/AcrR family transcriptional regulator [Clostridiales bacterium]|nr:TetR/AcrR family transcriptional regulator [Clostridiales bacterium]
MKKIEEHISPGGVLSEEHHMTKRQLQAIETRNRIYNAAVEIINEKGFNNVSIEDITIRANVAKGSFYTHFDSKEALVFYTFQQSDIVYEKAYRQICGLRFLPMIRKFVRISYQEYEKRGKGIIRAIISNYFSFPDYNFYNDDRSLLKCLSSIIEKGKTDGDLAVEKPTRDYVNVILSTLIGVETLWCFDDQGRSLADLIEETIAIVANGMMKENTKMSIPADS